MVAFSTDSCKPLGLTRFIRITGPKDLGLSPSSKTSKRVVDFRKSWPPSWVSCTCVLLHDLAFDEVEANRDLKSLSRERAAEVHRLAKTQRDAIGSWKMIFFTRNLFTQRLQLLPKKKVAQAKKQQIPCNLFWGGC